MAGGIRVVMGLLKRCQGTQAKSSFSGIHVLVSPNRGPDIDSKMLWSFL